MRPSTDLRGNCIKCGSYYNRQSWRCVNWCFGNPRSLEPSWLQGFLGGRRDHGSDQHDDQHMLNYLGVELSEKLVEDARQPNATFEQLLLHQVPVPVHVLKAKVIPALYSVDP